jgi:hypothetical protein
MYLITTLGVNFNIGNKQHCKILQTKESADHFLDKTFSQQSSITLFQQSSEVML